MEQHYIGDILVRRGLLTLDRMEEALRVADERGAALTDVLTASHVLDEVAVARALAEEAGLPFLTELKVDQVPIDLVERMPINFARQHGVLPIGRDGERVIVAVANPLDPTPLDDLRALLGAPITAVAAPLDAIERAINRVYERKDENALSDSSSQQDEEELQDLIDMTDEAPVIRWVNNLFYNAVRDRASDIHIEPTDKEVVVRNRIDGDLYPVKHAHKGFLPSIVARVKIEAGLNIAEKRLPQDGRITKKIQGKLIDVRVSTVPTAKGERIVMRLLDKENILLDLTDLGFDPQQLQTMEHLIRRPNGIILVTGPTGSGKTTTLYACLNKVNQPDVNILTVEDPVEYELKGIGQVHVQPKIGLTFASGLRSFLRQDPDIIMVGEIRDHETAEIAIHASLTGHLVLSTLHTNDAAGAVTRLVEMGVQAFHISSSLMAVLAQRLVRQLCKKCRTSYMPSDEDLRSLGINPSGFPPIPGSIPPPPPAPGELVGSEDMLDAQSLLAESERGKRPAFYRAAGCEACAHTGYRGRMGIYELLVITEEVRKEINNNSDSVAIARAGIRGGMRTLRQDGARQVLNGVTSLEEVLAATQAGDLE
ncbi:MAG: Type fimbrial assembly, ATPase PilB [Myxococcaceae bacterium]|nr:Type fimbrial assembly, ATPase PilB [Myxococcaceae bacterium]